jgi:hypothetical protein
MRRNGAGGEALALTDYRTIGRVRGHDDRSRLRDSEVTADLAGKEIVDLGVAGTALRRPVAGLPHHECFAPSRTNAHPCVVR